MTEELLQKVRRALPHVFLKKLPRRVTAVEVQEKEATRLNLVYRNKNKPANVLSFRYGPKYGEIIVCPAVIRREARAAGRPFNQQMTWMIMHGMIHLAGVHHEESATMAKKVEKTEARILSKLKTK